MIGTVVLDTDVASFIFKDDSRVRLYRPHGQTLQDLIYLRSMADAEACRNRGREILSK